MVTPLTTVGRVLLLPLVWVGLRLSVSTCRALSPRVALPGKMRLASFTMSFLSISPVITVRYFMRYAFLSITSRLSMVLPSSPEKPP